MSGSTQPRLGELLRTYRVHAGLSQESLSEISGVSVRTISDLERLQRASAHLETVRLLADALALTGDQRQQLLEAARPEPGPSSTDRAISASARWITTLPTPTTPFVGRTQELDELLTILERRTAKIVTITGTGGVGKTRLAVEAAHRVAPNLADGVLFVDLTTIRDPDRVPNAIAQALELPLQAAAPGEQVTRFLTTRQILLILDNFEQVIDASPFVAHVDATCPEVTVLVTSRARLRLSNEHELGLAPLALANVGDSLQLMRSSEANLLFAERARRVDSCFTFSDQNAVAVTEICRRLDGLPLAIELAASRLRVLSVPLLLERLDHRLPLLIGGDRDRAPRQQSLRATIAWSYELLPPNAQQLLRWMSVFTGGISLEAAEAIGRAIEMDSAASLEALTTLVESGLVQRTQPSPETIRFQMLETIREFGLEQLAHTGELEAARGGHAIYFLEFASRDAPRLDQLGDDVWIARLSNEHANLVQAFDHLCTPETAQQSLRFAAALGPYWDTRGPPAEGRDKLAHALEIAPAEPSILRLHTLCWSIFIKGTLRDLPGAVAAADQCLEMVDQVGTAADRAAVIQSLAWAYELDEQWDTARVLMERAMDLWADIGNEAMHAGCLLVHGGIEYAQGNLDRAKQDVSQANELFRDLGESNWMAGSEWYLGMFAMADNQPKLAAEHYECSLRTWIEIGSPARWFKPLVGLADVAASLGRFDTAARLLGAADEQMRITGMALMPFDAPGYQRAESASRRALGDSTFELSNREGGSMPPDEWLDEASLIIDAANAARAWQPQDS